MVHILHGAAAKNVGSVIMAYGQDLFEGVTGIFTTSIASLASTMIIIQLVFINETLLGNSKAKLFFAFGYFLALVIFYTTALICFPVGGGGKGEGDGVEEGEGMEMEGGGEDESEGGMVGSLGNLLSSKTRQQMLAMIPFQRLTTASFYCFSLGYLFGYWANLNLAKKTENATVNICFYLALSFIFYLFTVFILKSCSWQSGLICTSIGVIFGMVWSQIVEGKIMASAATAPEGDDDTRQKGTLCDKGNNDMICNAFRL